MDFSPSNMFERKCILLEVLLVVLVIVSQTSSLDVDNMKYLFERLGEPILLPKGENQDVFFSVPLEYENERYRRRLNATATALSNRSAGRRVLLPAASLKVTADVQAFAAALSPFEQFSPFVPRHRRLAKRLITYLTVTVESSEAFAAASALCRERVNRFLYTYALEVALLHRPDTQGAQLPLLPAVLPEKFFDGALFVRAREEANLVEPEDRMPLELARDWTASAREPEHRVAYFREDVGVNLHHWNWHLLYPHAGTPAVVRKDRRGELFYYMHHQMLARYNFERFSNSLSRTRRLLDWRAPIEEAYFPKLDSLVASRVWPSRPAGIAMQDLSRDDYEVNLDIQDMERWRDRIMEAVHNGRVETESGKFIPLDERQGIDILGNIIENSELSVNSNLYGDLHNMGHMFLSLIHDPDHRHLESFGVMGDVTTAMRDPVFYRWHAFINDIFTQHKRTLPPYTAQELGFEGVRVARVEVRPRGTGPAQGRANELRTFWQQSDVDFSRGLDFAPRGPLLARLTHLQHAPFAYHIQVHNDGPLRAGTVRIFMAPRFDERGTPLKFRDQQQFFIEMDKFVFMFRPGVNNVERASSHSSVTIPPERTFRDLNQEASSPEAQAQLYYCGCGWPQHMLVPKGSAQGFPVDLFVMVSNFADDVVVQPAGAPNMCFAAHSLCGVRGQLYPDRRPMGFPFDRAPRPDAPTLPAFLTPNMRVAPLRIVFSDRVLRAANASTAL